MIRHADVAVEVPLGAGRTGMIETLRGRMLASEVCEMRRALIAIGVTFLFLLPSERPWRRCDSSGPDGSRVG